MDGRPILLVDDDPLVVMETGEYLAAEGFDVICANSARDALRAMAESRTFAALVTDVDLGDGPDGFDVAGLFRALEPETPVVFISGFGGNRHAPHRARPSTFVAKPFQPMEIVDALAMVKGGAR